MPQLQLIARYTITDGNQDAVFALVKKLAEASRAEPGVLSFEAYRHLDDDRQVILLERYVSREALAAHRETAHFKDLVLGQIVPLLVSRVAEAYDVTD